VLSLMIVCVAFSLKAESPPAQDKNSRGFMKAVLTVSGGFTGIGGKWEVNLASDETRRSLAPDQLGTLQRLVAEARKAGVFGQDFSAAPSQGASGSPLASAAPGRADLQTYELSVDGEKVKWSEPAPAGASAAPPVLKELKQWMMRNAKRQPYQLHLDE
jgi:hypothetical protein